ncbi:MAG: Cation:proton antiporter, partial [uncultured Sphingomonadaceae bacterium]
DTGGDERSVFRADGGDPDRLPRRRVGRPPLPDAAAGGGGDDRGGAAGPVAARPARARVPAGAVPAGHQGRAVRRGAARRRAVHVPRRAGIRPRALPGERAERGGGVDFRHGRAVPARRSADALAPGRGRAVHAEGDAFRGDPVHGRGDIDHRVSDAGAHHPRTGPQQVAVGHLVPERGRDRRRGGLDGARDRSRQPRRWTGRRCEGDRRRGRVRGVDVPGRAAAVRPARPAGGARRRGARAGARRGDHPVPPKRVRDGRGRHPRGVRRLRARLRDAARGAGGRSAPQAGADDAGAAAADVLHLFGAQYAAVGDGRPEGARGRPRRARGVGPREGRGVLGGRAADGPGQPHRARGGRADERAGADGVDHHQYRAAARDHRPGAVLGLGGDGDRHDADGVAPVRARLRAAGAGAGRAGVPRRGRSRSGTSVESL